MRLPAERGVHRRRGLKRELLRLVLAVALVHTLFITGHLLFGLARAAAPLKIGYTAAWTAITLLIVLRGLARVRALRRSAGAPPR